MPQLLQKKPINSYYMSEIDDVSSESSLDSDEDPEQLEEFM